MTKKYTPNYDECNEWISEDSCEESELLKAMAHRMLDLADRIKPAGEPLTSTDKGLIRMALMPKIDAALSMAKASFLAGNHSDYIADEFYMVIKLAEKYNN